MLQVQEPEHWATSEQKRREGRKEPGADTRRDTRAPDHWMNPDEIFLVPPQDFLWNIDTQNQTSEKWFPSTPLAPWSPSKLAEKNKLFLWNSRHSCDKHLSCDTQLCGCGDLCLFSQYQSQHSGLVSRLKFTTINTWAQSPTEEDWVLSVWSL